MRVINLSSGSDGNLTYVESQRAKILVDDGLSCKETEKRLALIGVTCEQLDGIVVSHEHSDHIKGIDVLSKKYDVPVFAHSDVWSSGLDSKLSRVDGKNRKVFEEKFEISDLLIDPFEVSHDVKCFGYSIFENDKKISIVTDLGCTNERILKATSGSSLVYVEANHDVNLLKNNPKYSLALKMRIAGKQGHLSNDDSAAFISNLVRAGTRQIVLSHLSTENNTPELAYSYIKERLAEQELIEGETFKIDVALTRPTTFFRLKN